MFPIYAFTSAKGHVRNRGSRPIHMRLGLLEGKHLPTLRIPDARNLLGLLEKVNFQKGDWVEMAWTLECLKLARGRSTLVPGRVIVSPFQIRTQRHTQKKTKALGGPHSGLWSMLTGPRLPVLIVSLCIEYFRVSPWQGVIGVGL